MRMYESNWLGVSIDFAWKTIPSISNPDAQAATLAGVQKFLPKQKRKRELQPAL